MNKLSEKTYQFWFELSHSYRLEEPTVQPVTLTMSPKAGWGYHRIKRESDEPLVTAMNRFSNTLTRIICRATSNP